MESLREEIRKFVFSEQSTQDPEEHKVFFDQIKEKNAQGIFAI